MSLDPRSSSEDDPTTKLEMLDEDNTVDPVLARTAEVVRSGDLSQLTFKSVMAMLVAEFGPDVKAKKSQIRETVDATINAINSSEYESEEVVPVPKRKLLRAKTPVKKKPRPDAMLISQQLADFLELEWNDDDPPQMARTEVSRRLTQHVKANKLQLPDDKKVILCDDALKRLFGEEKITFLSAQRALRLQMKPATPSRPRLKRPPQKGSAFHRPYDMSPSLQVLMGTSEPMSRPQIVKHLWDYIKEHELQNPDDRRFIMCDDKMRAVFKIKKLHMMKMNKLLTEHLTMQVDHEDEL